MHALFYRIGLGAVLDFAAAALLSFIFWDSDDFWMGFLIIVISIWAIAILATAYRTAKFWALYFLIDRHQGPKVSADAMVAWKIPVPNNYSYLPADHLLAEISNIEAYLSEQLNEDDQEKVQVLKGCQAAFSCIEMTQSLRPLTDGPKYQLIMHKGFELLKLNNSLK